MSEPLHQSPGDHLRAAVAAGVQPMIGIYDVFSATLAARQFDERLRNVTMKLVETPAVGGPAEKAGPQGAEGKPTAGQEDLTCQGRRRHCRVRLPARVGSWR